MHIDVEILTSVEKLVSESVVEHQTIDDDGSSFGSCRSLMTSLMP